jgi:hypothetical protein
MASGELSTIERPRALPDANGHADHADHAALAPLDNGYADRSAELRHRPVSPFSPRQLSRLDEALTLSSRETGVDFSVYVGALDGPTRELAAPAAGPLLRARRAVDGGVVLRRRPRRRHRERPADAVRPGRPQAPGPLARYARPRLARGRAPHDS